MAGKGMPKTGGRAPGSSNKVTIEFRQTVTRLMEDNAANIALWLEQVAKEDPAKALAVIGNLAEYAYPKLARTEVTGAGGGPVKTVTMIQLTPLK